jgi:division protein CdvB (Snf7/Vps24/ESCRT-III family)
LFFSTHRLPSSFFSRHKFTHPPFFSPLLPHTFKHTQFDGDDVEEEADSVVNQVLTEIGLDMGSRMTDAPTGKLTRKQEEKAEAAEDKAAMEALEKLLPSMP